MRVSCLVTYLLISDALARSTAKTCVDYEIPVTVQSMNLIFAKPFQNNYDVVDFLSNAASRTAGTDFNPYSGAALQNASYTISATFCAPVKTASHNGAVFLASHGLDFDRRFEQSLNLDCSEQGADYTQLLEPKYLA